MLSTWRGGLWWVRARLLRRSWSVTGRAMLLSAPRAKSPPSVHRRCCCAVQLFGHAAVLVLLLTSVIAISHAAQRWSSPDSFAIPCMQSQHRMDIADCM